MKLQTPESASRTSRTKTSWKIDSWTFLLFGLDRRLSVMMAAAAVADTTATRKSPMTILMISSITSMIENYRTVRVATTITIITSMTRNHPTIPVLTSSPRPPAELRGSVKRRRSDIGKIPRKITVVTAGRVTSKLSFISVIRTAMMARLASGWDPVTAQERLVPTSPDS